MTSEQTKLKNTSYISTKGLGAWIGMFTSCATSNVMAYPK